MPLCVYPLRNKLTLLLGSSLLLSSMSLPSDALASQCGDFFRNNVRNHFNETFNSDAFSAMHAAVCSSNESYAENNTTYRGSAGLDVLWGSVFGSKIKRQQYRYAMCGSESNIDTQSIFYNTISSVVVPEVTNDFLRCFELEQGGLEVKRSFGEDNTSVIFDVSYSRGYAPRANVRVFGYTISPADHADKIACEGSLSSASTEAPVELDQTTGIATLVCRPNPGELTDGDNDFTVTLLSDLGTISSWIKPHYNGKTNLVSQLREEFEAEKLPTGTIAAFLLDQCPKGWIEADGQNGLPDLRGRFLIGDGPLPQEPQRSLSVSETGGGHRVRAMVDQNNFDCCDGDRGIKGAGMEWLGQGTTRQEGDNDGGGWRVGDWITVLPPFLATKMCVKR